MAVAALVGCGVVGVAHALKLGNVQVTEYT